MMVVVGAKEVVPMAVVGVKAVAPIVVVHTTPFGPRPGPCIEAAMREYCLTCLLSCVRFSLGGGSGADDGGGADVGGGGGGC